MGTHQIHDALPKGFAFANALQAEHYAANGWVHGARKVCWVRDILSRRDAVSRPSTLAVRLGPPKSFSAIHSELGKQDALMFANADQARYWYIREYEKGWRSAARTSEMPDGSLAFDDGYLDKATGRPKWHLTFCTDHDNCGEG